MKSPFFENEGDGFGTDPKIREWLLDLSRVAEKIYKQHLAAKIVTAEELRGASYAYADVSFHKQEHIDALCDFLFHKAS